MKRVVLVLLAIGMVLPAMAQEGPQVPCIVPCEHQAVARALQLTDDQIAQWDTLIADHHAAVEPVREQLQAVEQQLKELLSQPDPDPAQAGALTIQIHALREQIRAADDAYRQGFEALLDETQTSRLRFIRGAARVQAVIPAFRRFGLLRAAPADAGTATVRNSAGPAPIPTDPVN